MKVLAKILGVILGIAIIVIGINLLEADTSSIGAPLKFGADFYTEMYAVTKDVGYAVNRTTKAVHECAGWIVIVLGAMTACNYGNQLVEILEDKKRAGGQSFTSSDELPDL